MMNQPCGPSQDDVDPCDQCPGILDELQCDAAGVAEQAKYIAGVQAAITTARDKYKTARTNYTQARTANQQTVKDIRTTLTTVEEQIVCLIHDTEVVNGLKQAYEWVAERLAACGGSEGCCANDLDCDFDTTCEDKEDVLTGKIAVYTRTTSAAQACFDQLSTEPTDLATRISQLQGRVNGIATDLAGDTSKIDTKSLWARARVAQRDLDNVWLGFADANAYVTCLCEALTCLTKGHNAVAELTGRLAKLNCYMTAQETCCTNLRANVEDAIVARYLKTHPSRPPQAV